MSESDDLPLDGPTSTGVTPRMSAVLCYLAWWVSGLIFLIIEQQNRAVRFHAAQSLIVFGGLSILIGVLSVGSLGMLVISATLFQLVRGIVYLVWLGAVVLWVVVLAKTITGETWRVPLAGDLATKLITR